MQQLTLIGNLGKDAEMRYTPSGTPVTNFNLATNRTYKNAAGETVKETVWFKVSIWGKLAESLTQYLTKGKQVAVVGRLTADKATGGPRIWDKSDGGKGASFEVFADTVELLGGGSREKPEGAAGDTAPSESPQAEDEIPF